MEKDNLHELTVRLISRQNLVNGIWEQEKGRELKDEEEEEQEKKGEKTENRRIWHES